jgi:hypothetical protein
MSARSGLAVVDYFSPSYEATFSLDDLDMGTGGVLIVPGTGLLVTGEKAGSMFVMDPNNLGQFNSAANNVVQSWQAATLYFGTPVFFNDALYFWGSGSQLQAWALNAGTFAPRDLGTTTAPFSWVTTPALSVSSNGTQAGIVWATYPSSYASSPYPAVLQAFDASNVAVQLWSSSTDPTAPD